MQNDRNINKIYESYTHNIYKPIEEEVFFRPISRRVAKALTPTFVSPTLFNFLSLGGAVLTAFLFINGAHKGILAISLYITLLFDKIDGDLARAKGVAGGRGQYIDGVLDLLGEIVITLSIATAIGFSSIILVALSIVGPLLFYYHGVAKPFYLQTLAPTHRDAGVPKTWEKHLKELFSYGRAKHFILIILLVLSGHLELLFYILPLLIPYTLMLFAKSLLNRSE